ncbi:MAG: choice-of-anchor V domain-containing protein [Ferruginibacter sp.]|nr:hypothetical protein [Ferruginibacter sp.]
MKKTYTLFILASLVCIVPAFFSFKKPVSSGAAPTGYTGATGSYCTSCHTSYVLNSGPLQGQPGGTVTAPGLPTSIALGASYNFSAIITHGIADREKFGFAVKAVDAGGNAVGTFTTTNTNAGVSVNEIGHRNAPFVISTDSYTYNNLTWTAPTVAPTYPVTFYIVGNAANNGLGSSGDYIYSSTIVANAAVVPITLKSFNANLLNNGTIGLNWTTAQEINFDKFEIERSVNGIQFSNISTINSTGFSTNNSNYDFIDKNLNITAEYLYYRLKLIDKDGGYKYSSIEKISLISNTISIKKIKTISNTNGNIFELDIISPTTQLAQINWINTIGQSIKKESKLLFKGANNFTIQNKHLFSGEIVFLNISSIGLNKTFTMVN